MAGLPDQTIDDNATNPKKVQSDEGSVEQHSPKDLIDVDRYLASKAAVTTKNRGLRFSRTKAPSAVDP